MHWGFDRTYPPSLATDRRVKVLHGFWREHLLPNLYFHPARNALDQTSLFLCFSTIGNLHQNKRFFPEFLSFIGLPPLSEFGPN